MPYLVFLIAGAIAGVVAAALASRAIDRGRSVRRDVTLSQLAHDLRTPLSSITAYAEILKDDDTIEPAERSRFLGIIQEEAGRMETLITDRLGEGGPDAGRRVSDMTSAGRAVEAAATAASRTILVVDDDRFLVEATRTMLTREGFVALGAFGGEEALRQARAVNPDLILMDMGMPGMTGEETLGHLRGDAATRGIPVIITTGDDTVPAMEGAAAVLTKPVTRESLMAAIEAAARPARLLGGNHA